MFLFNAVVGRVWGGGNGDEENEMKGFMIAKLLLFFRCFVELENGGAKEGKGKGRGWVWICALCVIWVRS